MMRHPSARLKALSAVAGLATCAGIGVFAATSTPFGRAAEKPPGGPPPKKLTLPSPAAGWAEVDRLVDEQKMQAALDAAGKLREEAQKRGEGPEWARGLIREVQLRMALHGYETAVRFLREQPWPADPLPHALLDLFYAHALVTYQRAYGYEIARREEVVSTEVPDLKLWTREQIYLEAQKAYLSAAARRRELPLRRAPRRQLALGARAEQRPLPARARGSRRRRGRQG
jgi:hypothetical protein